jgi:hypothetical protein
VNRGEEQALAWALADSAAPLLSRKARTWLCAQIGAGELLSAITEVLGVYGRSNAEMPTELAESVAAWLLGYQGSDSEPGLLRLVARIRVAEDNQEFSQLMERARRMPLRPAPRRLFGLATPSV